MGGANWREVFNNKIMKLIHPIEPVFITQRFGENPNVYKQFGLKGHNGLDYRTKQPDTPLGKRYIIAPEDGVIEETGNEGNKGYGIYLRIRHTDGSQSTLGHLTKIYTAKGTKVKKGDRVALSGNTGFSTAPHLHWGFRPKNWDKSNGYAGYIDQLPLIGKESEPECTKCCPKHCK